MPGRSRSPNWVGERVCSGHGVLVGEDGLIQVYVASTFSPFTASSTIKCVGIFLSILYSGLQARGKRGFVADCVQDVRPSTRC